jgi:parallel beta-helix repeat protein
LAVEAGADHGLIQRNKVTFNVLGVSIETGSTDNTVQDNTVTGNRDFDLVDQNSGCDSNIWVDNDFETDQVDFKDDGGPDAGCIR